MVLMVVVVVAVGGVFARLFAYLGEPRLPPDLWKYLWKDLVDDNGLDNTQDGPAMWKIWSFGMGRPCGKSDKQWAKEKETAPFCFVNLL